MKGWQIFMHSIRQVFDNFEGALRVSGVLYLVQICVSLAFGGGAFMASRDMAQNGPGAGFYLGILVVLLVALVTGFWIAVAWHRYVLLGEKAEIIPTFRGDRIWAYLLRSLGYGLIVILIGAVWGMVVSFLVGSVLAQSMFVGLVLIGFLIYLPVLVIAFRMSADLPAAALGVERPFMSGWAATQGQTADLVSLAAIVVVFGVTLQLIGVYIFGQIAILSIIWSLLVGWVQMMVGVSILTTLYGHYIEKRALI